MDDTLKVGVPLRARLRVAVLSMHTSPTAALGLDANGGMNVYIKEACTAFSDWGIATDVFTRAVNPGRPSVERMAGMSRVFYIPAGPPGLDKYALLEMARPFAERVLENAEREGAEYDLVYSHYWLSGVAAACIAERLGVPWAHTAHTLGLVKNRQLARGATPEPPARIQAERAVTAAADLLIVSTESEGEDLVRGYGADPDRVAVVTPGVDLVRFRPIPRRAAAR
ncbi:MAG: glycosyltransferase, partial [Candidatus Dormibacterales bacterium]